MTFTFHRCKLALRAWWQRALFRGHDLEVTSVIQRLQRLQAVDTAREFWRLTSSARQERPSQAGELAEFCQGATDALTGGRVRSSGDNVVEIKGELLAVPSYFRTALESAERLTLRINSTGGHCEAALEMIEMITAKNIPVRVEIQYAASAAALLAMAGAERLLDPDGRLVIHSASVAVIGTEQDLRMALDRLATTTARMIDIFTRATGRPRHDVAQWFTGPDFVFNAGDALALGLVTGVSVGSSVTVEALVQSVAAPDASKSGKLLPLAACTCEICT